MKQITIEMIICFFLLSLPVHAGINLNMVPLFAKNGGFIGSLTEYVDYYSYVKHNQLEFLQEDWNKLRDMGRKFNVTIPKKQPKPRVGAMVYAGSQIIRSKLKMEVMR